MMGQRSHTEVLPRLVYTIYEREACVAAAAAAAAATAIDASVLVVAGMPAG